MLLRAEMAKFGQRFTVLRTIGMRLAVDDVVERCETNDHSGELDIQTSLRKVVEGSTPALDRKLSQNVEGSGVGGPRRAAEPAKCGCVDDNWELTSFLVGPAGDAQSCTEFFQCLSETFLVVRGGGRHEVDVVRLPVSAVELGAEAADHDVLDAVLIQHFDDSCRIERQALS